MKFYKLYKQKKKSKIIKFNSLNNGYQFSKKNKVKIFDDSILKYIFKTKFNNKLKKIITLYLELTENDEDTSNLLEPINALKEMLLTDYKNYFTREEIEKYYSRLEKLEKKCQKKKKKF